MSRPLKRFRQTCRDLIAEGVAPTCTEFQKRGLGYTTGKGSGCCFNSGHLTTARAEVLAEAGWTFKKYSDSGWNGRWVPPVS